MTRSLFLPILALLAVAALPALGQQKPPRLGYLYPAGIQQGTTAEISVGGQYLEGTTEVLTTGGGLTAKVVRWEKPLNGKRENELRDYLQEARKKAVEAQEPPKQLARFEKPDTIAEILKESGATEDEIRIFLLQRKRRNDPKRQQNVQLSESAYLQIEAAPDAAPGPREFRLRSPLGVSNPLTFCVGKLPETLQPEKKDKKAAPDPAITLPTVINGQILPGEVDRYAFSAPAGAKIVVAVQARDLIPYLADAVPGWFQPAVTIYDATGKEVAFSGAFRFNPDPVFCFEPAKTGRYLLELRDALYRGREDFVYRVTLGSVPFITGVFPLGAPVGETATVEVTGWNLGYSRMIVAPAKQEGIRRPANLANGFAIADISFADGAPPEVAETEPNDTLQTAQPLTLPVIVNGRIGKPGDVDHYRFSCKAGQTLVADVAARRLNSPLDSWLRLTDAAGRQLAFNDDQDDKGAGLLAHQADSTLTLRIPADGVYSIQLGDTQHKGGPEYAYRLRMGPPRPDFALRWVPSALNGKPGASVPVTVYAVRKDGFEGEIALALKNAPPGFQLGGGVIPPGKTKIQATLTFPPEPMTAPASLAVEGRATADGHELLRPAVPADDLLQAFAYHHLVPAQTLLAMSTGTSKSQQLTFMGSGSATLFPGGSSQLALKRNGRLPGPPTEIKIQTVEPVDGISVGKVALTSESLTITLNASADAKPGVAGNLILEAFAERTPPPADGKSPEKKRWSIGTLPAISIRVADPKK